MGLHLPNRKPTIAVLPPCTVITRCQEGALLALSALVTANLRHRARTPRRIAVPLLLNATVDLTQTSEAPLTLSIPSNPKPPPPVEAVICGESVTLTRPVIALDFPTNRNEFARTRVRSGPRCWRRHSAYLPQGNRVHAFGEVISVTYTVSRRT